MHTRIVGVNATVNSREALDGAGVVIAGTGAAGVRVALWVLLFIPVAAVIRLAGLFVMILITAVLIIVEKPGGKMFDINIDIGLDISPDEGILGCLLGAYLCGLYNKINGAVSRRKN